MKVTLYDILAIICLIIGGALLLGAACAALAANWLPGILCALAGFAVWHLSTTFARYAIAASGRQK